MKIAVTSEQPDLEGDIDSRFGRCPYFLIVDTDTLQFEAVENPSVSLGGGAGIQAAQFMAQKGVKAVITGNCGPNAFQALTAAGIEVASGVSGASIKQAIEDFKSGEFIAADESTAPSHYGLSMAEDKKD